MPSFEEIGLREELRRTLEDEEIEVPTKLQASVIPALRRGGNLVARASSGSGKTLAYALGVLDRLEVPEDEDESEEENRAELRLLVLTPTPPEAERVALAVTPFAQAVDLSVGAITTGWGAPASDVSVLAATIGDAMEAVRASTIKLDGLEAIIVDGAASIEALGELDQVDALIDLIPRDAQRVIVSTSLTDGINDLVERRVKRALRYPAEPAIPGDGAAAPAAGSLAYVVTGEREKLELLAAQLRVREAGVSPPIVFCRTDERAAELAEQLTLRGFIVGATNDSDAHLAIAAGVSPEELIAELGGETRQTISYDVPADVDTLVARHGGDADAVVLVQPREVAHIRELAAQAKFRARSTAAPADTSVVAAALRTFRDEVRRAVQHEDLTAQMLILEPLLDEFSATEIAAALAGLLRSRRPAATAQPSAAAQQPPSRGQKEAASAPGPAPATWARLFVSLGSRDEVRPGDLVGALAGEAGIPGSRIGKIEIRDTFSIVEVQSDAAEQVIRAVNGTTMKGRSVRVDYDRGGPAKRPPSKGGPPRRNTRRPPGATGGRE